MSDPHPSASVDPRLLSILVCPVSHEPLVLDAGAGELLSHAAGLAYPIRDGVPIMLPEEARRLDAPAAAPTPAPASTPSPDPGA